MKTIAIIGGGASGLYLASLLEKSSYKTLLIEKNDRIGKKILITGNGKCNLSNMNINLESYNNSFALEIINNYTNLETLNYFEKLGLLYYCDEEQRVYPYSDSANTVLDVLRRSLKKVEIITNSEIIKIEVKKNKQFILYNKNNKVFYCDILVLACGGKTYYNNYNYIELVNKLNIKTNTLKPSLVGLKVKENIKSLENIRVKAMVSLYNNNSLIHQENGEVLFKKEGLSGIVIFNMHSFYNRIKELKQPQLVLDLFPQFDENQLKKIFDNKSDPLFGVFNKMLAKYLYSLPGDLLKNLKHLTFNITDSFGFTNAQVTSGGVCIDQIDSFCKVKNFDNLYIMGEMLDIDGICGGYNLQFAFSCAGSVYKDLLRSNL